MAIIRHKTEFARLDGTRNAAWRGVAPAIASDCMNRSGAMSAKMKPLDAAMAIAGQARTVSVMAGDNSAIHALLREKFAGEVLVIAAGGIGDVAVWGGLLTEAARAAGLAGVVVDGAVRDAGEIRRSGFPCYAVAITPRGPHKGFGGEIDGLISCAGVPVRPGDLILGDGDGVVVVPLEREGDVLAAARKRLAAEDRMRERLHDDVSLADQLGVGPAEDAG